MNNGSSWTDAYSSLSDCINGGLTADDLILVEYRHDKDYGATTSLLLPCSVQIVSVNKDTGAYQAGAKESTTTGDLTLGLTAACRWMHVEGVQFSTAGGGGTLAVSSLLTTAVAYTFLNCVFTPDDDGGFTISSIVGNAVGEYKQCAFTGEGGRTSWASLYPGRYLFSGCVWTGHTGSATLITTVGSFLYDVVVQGADLSSFATAVDVSAGFQGQVVFRRCRLQSDVTLVNGTLNFPDVVWTEYCSDAVLTGTPLGLSGGGDTYPGTMATGTVAFDVTVYRTTDGASDGENQYSVKMTCDADAAWHKPLRLPLKLHVWHDALASKRLTIRLASDDAALTDAKVWAEVGSGDEGQYATGVQLTTRAGYGAGVAADVSTYLKSDTEAWTGTGPTTVYKLEVTGLGQQEPGTIDILMCFADGLQTLWVCPNVELVDE